MTAWSIAGNPLSSGHRGSACPRRRQKLGALRKEPTWAEGHGDYDNSVLKADVSLVIPIAQQALGHQVDLACLVLFLHIRQRRKELERPIGESARSWMRSRSCVRLMSPAIPAITSSAVSVQPKIFSETSTSFAEPGFFTRLQTSEQSDRSCPHRHQDH